jgi:hypothetical protein
VDPDTLFEVARLVVAAEIAKAHTIEWTPQLLYDEPLSLALRANWFGLLDADADLVRLALSTVVRTLGRSRDGDPATTWYSVFASGPGIFGLGNRIGAAGARDAWSLANPDHVNGGTNHFGSPFNFPEEFVTVYRLHPMLPDLLELRALERDPNVVRLKLPVADVARGPGNGRDANPWAGELGCLARAPARRAPDAPEPPAVSCRPSTCRGSEARRGRSTWRRSTSSATASGACRGSTSSAGSTDSGS